MERRHVLYLLAATAAAVLVAREPEWPEPVGGADAGAGRPAVGAAEARAAGDAAAAVQVMSRSIR